MIVPVFGGQVGFRVSGVGSRVLGLPYTLYTLEFKAWLCYGLPMLLLSGCSGFGSHLGVCSFNVQNRLLPALGDGHKHARTAFEMCRGLLQKKSTPISSWNP